MGTPGKLGYRAFLRHYGLHGVEKETDGDLKQYGIPGMKWGVRRKDPSKPATPENVEVLSKPGARLKARGGANQPASDDAIKTAERRQRAKASTSDALTTKELQELVNRWNLEQSYAKLAAEQRAREVHPAKKFLKKYMSDEVSSLQKGKATTTGSLVKVFAGGLRKTGIITTPAPDVVKKKKN